MFVLPTQLATAYFDRELFEVFEDFNEDSFANQSDFGVGGFGGSPITTLLGFLILPFLGVAFTHLVLGWRAGIDRGARECLVFTLKKAHIIVVVFAFAKIIQVVTLLLSTPWLMLAAPIIAAEDLGPVAAIRRSFALGRTRYGSLFAVVLLVVLINFLLSYALLGLPLALGFVFGDWGWIAFFGLGIVGTTVLTLLGTGAAVLAYVDVRNRTEGMHIAERVKRARSSNA